MTCGLNGFARFCAAILTLGSLAGAQPPRGELLQWADTKGAVNDPLGRHDGRIAVLFFMTTDCPIANAYAPEVNRIIDKYSKRGVAFYIVDVDYGLTAEEARKHAHEYGYTCTTLLDPLHTLAGKAGATVSSEAVVVGPQGSIVYRGRIDDRAVGYGKIRPAPTHQDLRVTLDDVLAGQQVPVPHTPCVGCIISPPLRSGR